MLASVYPDNDIKILINDLALILNLDGDGARVYLGVGHVIYVMAAIETYYNKPMLSKYYPPSSALVHVLLSFCRSQSAETFSSSFSRL